MDLKFRLDPTYKFNICDPNTWGWTLPYACTTIMLGCMRDAKLIVTKDLLCVYAKEYNLGIQINELSEDRVNTLLTEFNDRLTQFYYDSYTTKLSHLLTAWTPCDDPKRAEAGTIVRGVIPIGTRSIFNNFLKIPKLMQLTNCSELMSDTLTELRYAFKMTINDQREIPNQANYELLTAQDIEDFKNVLNICIQWAVDRANTKCTWNKNVGIESFQYYINKLVDFIELATFVYSANVLRTKLGMNYHEILEQTWSPLNRDSNHHSCVGTEPLFRMAATYSHLPMGIVVCMAPGVKYNVSRNMRPDHTSEAAHYLVAQLLLERRLQSYATHDDTATID